MCMYTLLASQDFKIGHVLLHKPLFLALAERRLGKDVAEMWVYKGRTRLWILSAAPLLVNNSLLLVLAIACHNNSRISGIYIYIYRFLVGFASTLCPKDMTDQTVLITKFDVFGLPLIGISMCFIESRSFCVGDSFSWLGWACHRLSRVWVAVQVVEGLVRLYSWQFLGVGISHLIEVLQGLRVEGIPPLRLRFFLHPQKHVPLRQKFMALGT